MTRRFFLILLLALLTPLASAKAPLRVLVMQDVHADYQRFLAGRNPLTIRHYGGPYSRRDVVELVLLQQALAAGGSHQPLQLLPQDSTPRMLKNLADGQGEISGHSFWKSDATALSADLGLSEVLIPNGHFEAGLYLRATAPQLNEQLKRNELSKLTAVCVRSWQSDILALQQSGFRHILLTDRWESMLAMLQKGRADVMLAPFNPTPDLHLLAGGQVYKPLPGLKIALAGSRHFVLSRRSPGYAKLQAEVDRGLLELKREGRLDQAYRESGFWDSRVAGWRLLNP